VIDIQNVTDRDRTEAQAAAIDGYARAEMLRSLADSCHYTPRQYSMVTGYVRKVQVRVIDDYTIEITGPNWKSSIGHDRLTPMIELAWNALYDTPLGIHVDACCIDTGASPNVERMTWRP
jgi:hypothetical protein